MELDFHCPYHGKNEKMDLPENYYNFDGEITCPSHAHTDNAIGNPPYVLRVKITLGKLVKVERAI